MSGERIPQATARAAAKTVLARLDLSQRIGVEPMPFERSLFLGADPIAEMRNAARVNQSYSWRREMHEALDRLCGLCGLPIAAAAEVTFDHVVPRARGGGNYANLLPAHSDCNGAKSDRMPTACERIMLEVVNLRLGNRLYQSAYTVGRQSGTLGAYFLGAAS